MSYDDVLKALGEMSVEEILANTKEVGINEIIQGALEMRLRDGADKSGNYHSPDLREHDIVLKGLGYEFDPASGIYERKSSDQIVIPELSEQGEAVLARQKEYTALRSAKNLSNSEILERISAGGEPILPDGLMTNDNARDSELSVALLDVVPSAKQIRLYGFDHEVDLQLQVQEAYHKAAENGAIIKLYFHKEYASPGIEEANIQKLYNDFINMVEDLPHSVICPAETSYRSQQGPFKDSFHYALKAIDNTLLSVTHHRHTRSQIPSANPFTDEDASNLREIIANKNGIPGIETGFHNAFDQYFGNKI